MAKKASAKDLSAATDAFIKAIAVLEPIRLKVWDDGGLTVVQLRALFQLGVRDGMSNAELANRLRLSRPAISALLERLERKGYIKREISRADRREIKINLEPKGNEAISGANDGVRKELSTVLASLDEDQLRQITDGLLLVANIAG